eukprot:CAMPEP_0116572350 /NCGR_PEP_ID=MMETSP0397-20121206/18117_1 /TAXON_ID=216820 /ORGANISM="Cyclophora tenuis, Strain ECT3854" /LENGTH=57 /DNA_ID=CAMNT_0004100649 /DNA_START=40 /DNA_END=213 /DNA_ORIENTATION=+
MVFEHIPSELHLPVVVAVGILGFLAVIGLSKMSTYPVKTETAGPAPTSKKTSRRKED